MKYTLRIVLFFLFNYSSSFCQSLIGSGGTTFTNNNTSVSWSLGELSTNNYNGNRINEGFQQPILQLVTGINTEKENSIVKVYPNPINAFLNVEILSTNENYNIEIIDSKGSIILKNNVESMIKLDFTKFNSGYYIIRLFNNKDYQQFKIIKN